MSLPFVCIPLADQRLHFFPSLPLIFLPVTPDLSTTLARQAYGEVIWFGGSVNGLTLVSFFLMVGSSVIAAWSDISSTLARLSAGIAVVDPTSGAEVPLPIGMLGRVNEGYAWMAVNCFASAAYVSSLFSE